MQHRSGRFRRFVAEEMSGGMGEERRPDLRLLVPALGHLPARRCQRVPPCLWLLRLSQ